MESLLFSLHATIPVFLLIVLGGLFRRGGLLNDAFCQVSDKLVFHVALPVMLFLDMAKSDIRQDFDLPYLLFCAGVTSLIFFSLWFLARRFLPERHLVGEFVQVSYRSSAAILGLAIIKSVYGTVGAAPLMILGSVPLFNLYAVLLLTMEGPQAKEGRFSVKLRHALRGAVTNPIILGILLGLLYSLVGLPPLPSIAQKTLDSLAVLATPLALLSIGASLRLTESKNNLRLANLAAAIKLLLLPALFLPLAIVLGLRDTKLLAFLIMLGSTSTPTCYIMAKNLGHDGRLSISTIVLTTLFSAFTLTLWIFLARFLGYLA